MGFSVTAVVPARNEAERLPETLAALAGIPSVARVIVVDDGSRDATVEVARSLGARVLSGTVPGKPRGKGHALLVGLSCLRNAPGTEALLLADADLGPTASALGALIPALNKDTPAAIATFPQKFTSPPEGPTGGLGLVKSFSRRAIARRNNLNYVPAEPLSGQRALLPAALDALPGIAPGFGAEVGMTLDLLAAGIRPAEIPLHLAHRRTGKTPAGFAHRARQGLDILKALNGARLPW